jgi:hypothetical protein
MGERAFLLGAAGHREVAQHENQDGRSGAFHAFLYLIRPKPLLRSAA